MTKLSLTVLVAALLVSAPVLVSGKEKAFYTVTVSPGYTASAHREDNAYYQPRLAREAQNAGDGYMHHLRVKRDAEGSGIGELFDGQYFINKSTHSTEQSDEPINGLWVDSDHDGYGASTRTSVPSPLAREAYINTARQPQSNLVVNRLRGTIKMSVSESSDPPQYREDLGDIIDTLIAKDVIPPNRPGRDSFQFIERGHDNGARGGSDDGWANCLQIKRDPPPKDMTCTTF